MITVFIVDDHKMVIDGIQLMLDSVENISVVGSALDAENGIEQLKVMRPDVLLLDVNLPGMNGVDMCKIINVELPETKIIALSMHKESSIIKLMLQNGAKGYVLKNAGQDEVVQAIKSVYSGKTYLDSTVNEIVIQSLQSGSKSSESSSPFPTLSRREKEILRLILEEYTTQEIADKLFISFGTVETHRRNMLVKTGARNTAGLVRISMEYNLLDD